MPPFLAAVTWDVSPIIAHLGPLTLRWYGLFFMSGFVVGTFVLTHMYRAEKVAASWVDTITVYMLVGTIVGARLGHCLFYDPVHYLSHPLEILKVWEGGLASHGATVGISLACWLFARQHKFDFVWVVDRMVIVIGIGGALIRLGNLMNSEIVGRPAEVPWAFVFPRDTEHLLPAAVPLQAGAVPVAAEAATYADGSQGYRLLPAGTPPPPTAPVAVPRHPTQLYEATFFVLLTALLYGLWHRTKERTPRGLLVGLFMVLLFSERFLGEFLKENQGAFDQQMMNATGLDLGQLLSLPLILIGLGVLWRAGKDPANPHGFAPRDLEVPAA